VRKKNAALMVLFRRLLKGARILGEIWERGDRCGLGWSKECDCESPNPFCEAKARWLKLVEQERAAGEKRPWTPKSDHPFYIADVMKVSEVVATKVTVKLEVPDVGTIKVGPKGDYTWKAYRALMAEPGSMIRMQHILKLFPGSKVSR
jgi:hypothetical protein